MPFLVKVNIPVEAGIAAGKGRNNSGMAAAMCTALLPGPLSVLRRHVVTELRIITEKADSVR